MFYIILSVINKGEDKTSQVPRLTCIYVSVSLNRYLAHLSQRLIGELIVYP